MEDVAVVDCDGVIINSIPGIRRVSTECVGKFFPVEDLNKKLEKLVVRFGGEGFTAGSKKALESLFPEEEHRKKREECHQMIIARRREIYDKARPFPGAIEAVKLLSESFHLVISSALECDIIYYWLRRNGLGKGWFEMICGEEDGEKSTHLELIRRTFPGAWVWCIGNSPADMLGDFPIGVAEQLWHKELLLAGGAGEVISALEEIFDVLY